ncbi:MAG: hypothetical protein JWN89_297 [Parcubacteria group bacterium]|nr:hypothetical protein [Parcubacteria group bacterium]
MSIRSTGVNFVLDATNDEQRAINLVRLLHSLVYLDMVDRADRTRWLSVKDTHKHLPVFAETLGLGHCKLYSYDEETKDCPAVTLYERAFTEHSDGKNLSWHFMHLREFDRTEIMQDCLKLASGVAVGFSEKDLDSAITAFYTAVRDKGTPATA